MPPEILVAIIECFPDKHLLRLRTVSTEFRAAVDNVLRRRAKFRRVAVTNIPALVARGDLERLKWATSLFKLAPGDVRSRDNLALRSACANGSLPGLKWLVGRFGLTRADARSCHNLALRTACARNHLKVAKWMASHFKLTIEDVCDDINETLRAACAYGHLAVAQWLVDQFGLTFEVVCDDINHILRTACERNHLAIAQWLVVQYGLTAEVVRADHNALLRGVRTRGQVKVLKWLALAAPFDTYRAHNDEALRTAGMNGHLGVVKYLVENLGLDRLDDIFRIRKRHCVYRNRDPEVAEWLARHFGSTTEGIAASCT